MRPSASVLMTSIVLPFMPVKTSPGFWRAAAGQVLGAWHDARPHAAADPTARAIAQRADHRGRAGHVALHAPHLLGLLDRDAAGVERDPLADKHDSGQIRAAGIVLQDDKPGRFLRLLCHGQKNAHAQPGHLLPAKHLDPQPQLFGQPRGGIRHQGRRHVVRPADSPGRAPTPRHQPRLHRAPILYERLPTAPRRFLVRSPAPGRASSPSATQSDSRQTGTGPGAYPRPADSPPSQRPTRSLRRRVRRSPPSSRPPRAPCRAAVAAALRTTAALPDAFAGSPRPITNTRLAANAPRV